MVIIDVVVVSLYVRVWYVCVSYGYEFFVLSLSSFVLLLACCCAVVAGLLCCGFCCCCVCVWNSLKFRARAIVGMLVLLLLLLFLAVVAVTAVVVVCVCGGGGNYLFCIKLLCEWNMSEGGTFMRAMNVSAYKQ